MQKRKRTLAQQFRRHIRMIGRLKNHFRQTGTKSDRPRQWHHRVTTRRQDRYIWTTHLRNRFRSVTAAARTIQGAHFPRISTQTQSNCPLRWSKINFGVVFTSN